MLYFAQRQDGWKAGLRDAVGVVVINSDSSSKYQEQESQGLQPAPILLLGMQQGRQELSIALPLHFSYHYMQICQAH